MSSAKIFANFYLRKTKNGAGLPKRYELTFRLLKTHEKQEEESEEEEKEQEQVDKKE